MLFTSAISGNIFLSQNIVSYGLCFLKTRYSKNKYLYSFSIFKHKNKFMNLKLFKRENGVYIKLFKKHFMILSIFNLFINSINALIKNIFIQLLFG